MAKRPLIIKRLGILAASLAILAMAVYVANDLLDLDLGWRLHLLRVRLFGEPIAGLCRPDDRYGWRLKPGERQTVRTPDFTVTYTIGPEGDRIVPGAPGTGPTVALLGGSVTMGTGVRDDEALASVLQRDWWASYRVRNMGCEGYATSHVLLRLEDEFKAGRKFHLVIYNWIYHHFYRNYLRRNWLTIVAGSDAKNPLFDVKDGNLEFKGLVGLDQAVNDDDPGLVQRELAITEALLGAIQRLCRDHGARFALVMLPARTTQDAAFIDEKIVSTCRSLSIACLDLTRHPALLGRDKYFAHDPHPNASWHRTAARLIAQGIDVKTGQVRPVIAR